MEVRREALLVMGLVEFSADHVNELKCARARARAEMTLLSILEMKVSSIYTIQSRVAIVVTT